MKIHIRASDVPLREGSRITANCGEVVANAVFPGIWDTAMLGALTVGEIDPFRLCTECFGTTEPGQSLYFAERYVYAVVEGQEIR